MATLDVVIPAVGESITEVVIGKWFKKNGESVRMDDMLCELETDKATMEVNAEQAGILEILVPEGSTVAVGAVVARIQTDAAEGGPASDAPAAADASAAAAPATVAGSPAAVAGSPTAVAGSPAAVAAAPAMSSAPSVPASSVPLASTTVASASNRPDSIVRSSAPAGPQRRERMSQLRKTIARRLVAVKNETAMLTTFNEVNMGPLMEMRSRYKDSFKERYGVGLGFMSLFAKAVCLALREFPVVNAGLDGEDLVYHDYVDLSIAVSAPRGLMVPVVRGADHLALHEIEREIARLAGKAREGTLSVDEMAGGTFTITNGGVFGSMLSTPIINAPQSAILGMHNIVERPIALQGQVVIRPIMYIALSYDHRLIDGKDSVSFLVRVKEFLEDPYRMLIEI
ncbi:MAG: 2-oxoglutarate dehydrogenase complex dihydrolipoyllysine-residue succinyltransferase [Bacteroidetes bacterium]|jgi:2-oxoglutarate dehydrogenase E2 component (dihydrolipoamide succinyltransferase)|nr:2-oxoglutarate dehydrogenase complex dihydrolipoyllysine-residue succinyltransferase [Bacteroidota bacterium]